jgi:hypothetical protein
MKAIDLQTNSFGARTAGAKNGDLYCLLNRRGLVEIDALNQSLARAALPPPGKQGAARTAEEEVACGATFPAASKKKREGQDSSKS